MNAYGTNMSKIITERSVSIAVTNGKITVNSAVALEVVERLVYILPHGSGVNYDWSGYELKGTPGTFVLYNTYDAMNESGMYCHSYPFKVKVSVGLDGKFYYESLNVIGRNKNRERMCCESGLWEYLDDLMAEALYDQSIYFK